MSELFEKQDEKLVDLGNATELTKGYCFDSVYEITTHDKLYDFVPRSGRRACIPY